MLGPFGGFDSEGSNLETLNFSSQENRRKHQLRHWNSGTQKAGWAKTGGGQMIYEQMHERTYEERQEEEEEEEDEEMEEEKMHDE